MYFKRYRMEITLAGRNLAPPPAPDGYRFEAWNPALLDGFAEAKYQSFHNEIDANVFPCLGEIDGCRRLMREIVRKPGFLPETTWLLTYSRGSKLAGVLRHCAGHPRCQRAGRDPEPGRRAGASQRRAGHDPAFLRLARLPARSAFAAFTWK